MEDVTDSASESSGVSVPEGAKQAGEMPRPLGVGRTDGLDAAYADGPRNRGERRPMVQPDR